MDQYSTRQNVETTLSQELDRLEKALYGLKDILNEGMIGIEGDGISKETTPAENKLDYFRRRISRLAGVAEELVSGFRYLG